MLRSEDYGLLKARRRLVTYLIEVPVSGGRPCARLTHYRRVAWKVWQMLRDTDELASSEPNSPTNVLVDDLLLREELIVKLIRSTDLDIQGMVDAQKWNTPLDEICGLYARLVMGHENDLNCDRILEHLRLHGLKVPAPGTCA